jgi:hypothetical protein
MKIPGDDQEDSLSEWQRDPTTLRVLKGIRARHAQARERLVGVCAVSTDPSVRAAFESWLQLTAMIGVFEGRAPVLETK